MHYEAKHANYRRLRLEFPAALFNGLEHLAASRSQTLAECVQSVAAEAYHEAAGTGRRRGPRRARLALDEFQHRKGA